MGPVLAVGAFVAGAAGAVFASRSQPNHAPSDPWEERRRYEQQCAEVQRQRIQDEEEQRRRQQQWALELEAQRRREEEVQHQVRAEGARTEQLRREAEQLRYRMEQEQALQRRREREVQEKENQLARERAELQQREEEARNYPLQLYQQQSNWQGTVNVGLVGNSGVGKSFLSNKMRNVRRGQPGWSPVGVSETTQQPQRHDFPGAPWARLWDLPGAGTQAHPRESYIRDVGLRHFDAVLVISAGRFTETEQLLIGELRQYRVPFFAVRTKVDQDIQNNQMDNAMAPETTKGLIASDLRDHGIANPYLINSREPTEHDFPKLMRDLYAAVTHGRRAAEPQPQQGWGLPLFPALQV